MKALAVLVFMIGCMAILFSTEEQDHVRQRALERNVATNYALFREAVLLHVFATKPTGDISYSALELPQGWLPLRNWRARITGESCLIWGPASAGEISATRELLYGSLAVGRAQGGRLVPGFGAFVPVPGIPDGSLVSVINVD